MPILEYNNNWINHSNGDIVTNEEKKARAIEIAMTLSDNNKWKSHGRAINMQELEAMKLKITDYGIDKELSSRIDTYNSVLIDYVNKYQTRTFVHTRRFL